ncbi:MAG: hypothetical protein N2316_06450 [Spirochaetes bacterium]|nr:hypothetical protein [Spirochaetota bacterium]
MVLNLYYPVTLVEGILIFGVYSFAGWIIEVVYRSWSQRRFVNAGFLFGPFVPLYGMGALLVCTLGFVMKGYHPFFFIMAIAIVLSMLEYFIGFFSEKTLGLKLWDYSNNRFNLHGRICLTFSIVWTLLAVGLALFVHPKIYSAIKSLDPVLSQQLATAFMFYYVVDLSISTISAFKFKKKASDLLANFSFKSDEELQTIIRSLKRLLNSFPNLNRYLDGTFQNNLRMRVGNVISKITNQAVKELKSRKPIDKEYISIVKDILMNSEFQKLRNYYHHNSSIYDHARRVSYVSYKICKVLNLDYRAAARGGLLHDFFLYDWRTHTEPELASNKLHGIHHPRIALKNSEKQFLLSEKEKDIIVKHMWPLTLTPPRYRESYVVTFVDKYLSSAEFFAEFAKKATSFTRRKYS